MLCIYSYIIQATETIKNVAILNNNQRNTRYFIIFPKIKHDNLKLKKEINKLFGSDLHKNSL